MFRLLFRLVTDSKQPSVHGNYVSTGIYPFSVFLLSTYPCLCATPRCPWWAAQLRKPFKKIFFSLSFSEPSPPSFLLLLLFFFLLFKSTFAFLFLFQPRRSSILLAPIHPLSIIYPTWFLFLNIFFYLNLRCILSEAFVFILFLLIEKKNKSFFSSSYFLCLYISRG